MIVEQTNLYARHIFGEEQYAQFVQVTVDELQAYLGFCVLMGLVQMPAMEDYWKRDVHFHYAPVADRISRSRFREISRYLHFANKSNLPQRGESGFDQLRKVRPVLEALQSRFEESYDPHCEQSIDEAMIKFQGRSTIKQYLPAKPIKRGIKVWCRADAHNGYLLQFDVYTGHSESASDTTLGERVVTDLSRKLEGKHYHLYFDNFFCSVTLLRTLLANSLYGSGTARQSYKDFSQCLKMKGNGKKRTSRKRFEEKVNIQYIIHNQWTEEHTFANITCTYLNMVSVARTYIHVHVPNTYQLNICVGYMHIHTCK